MKICLYGIIETSSKAGEVTVADSDGNTDHDVPVVYEPVGVDTVAEEPGGWIGNTPHTRPGWHSQPKRLS